MQVGICTIFLRIPENHSLKEERQVVRSVIDRVKHRFNVAITEVDALDSHQTAVLGAAAILNDSRHVNRTLSHVVNFVEETSAAELADYKIKMY